MFYVVNSGPVFTAFFLKNVYLLSFQILQPTDKYNYSHIKQIKNKVQANYNNNNNKKEEDICNYNLHFLYKSYARKYCTGIRNGKGN